MHHPWREPWPSSGLLLWLLHLGPLSQTELCRKLLRTSGNLTMVVDHLEKRGLVSRRRTIPEAPKGSDVEEGKVDAADVPAAAR